MAQFMGGLLAVRDMRAAKRFYCELLGQSVTMNINEVNVTLDGKFSLQTLDMWAGFIDRQVEEIRLGNLATELYFEVEDLDEFIVRLKDWPETVEEVCPLKEFPWGQRSLHLYDPDRHVVEVGESMKNVVKRLLGSGLSAQQAVERTGYPLEFMEMCARELAEEGKK